MQLAVDLISSLLCLIRGLFEPQPLQYATHFVFNYFPAASSRKEQLLLPESFLLQNSDFTCLFFKEELREYCLNQVLCPRLHVFEVAERTEFRTSFWQNSLKDGCGICLNVTGMLIKI
jgi:hypothetical protein